MWILGFSLSVHNKSFLELFLMIFIFSELVSASVEPVDKDKARKVLERVDFLSRLRESVAVLPDLADRLDSLAEPALDLPEWWIPGKHDADLVVGAAR